VPSAEVSLDDEQLAAVVGDRQSDQLGRSDELASADLRRWLSRCSRAAMRAFAADTTFFQDRTGLLLGAARGVSR